MKLKMIAVILGATAAFTSTSSAVTVNLAGIANASVGLISLDGSTAVSGRAVFVSTDNPAVLAGANAALSPLLGSSTTTPANFDLALANLIGATSAATNPGVVRTVNFLNGGLTSTGPQEMGSVGNSTFLFLVSEREGFVTGIGAYTGAAVPPLGAVTINPSTAGDSIGIGASISGFQLAKAIPEPSTALLGALGALGLLRRRR